ncbi:MlaD family protein [Nocardia sp. NPDC056000]|uniref:MlaD family protein n=1 Tax=Nocardia sp. NPDC056000 TaxID=3345674 RepID=UPI0035DF7C3B
MRIRLGRPKTSSIVSLGALAGVLLIGIAYLGLGVLRYDPFADLTRVRMVLANSGSIGIGTPVLLTGIPIGTVTTVRRGTAGVEVSLEFAGAHHIPVSSAVKIENLSALGEPYIDFQPPDTRGPYLRDGQQLDTAKVQVPLLIPDLSVKAVQFIRQLDPATMTSLVHTLDTTLTGTEAQLPQLERATSLLAATLLSRTGTIRQLLTDLQTTGADMDWTGPALAASGPYWSLLGQRLEELITTASRVIEKGDAPHDYLTGNGVVPFLNQLNATMTRLGPEFTQLVPVLQPLTADATSSLGRLDISALIAQALGTVGDDSAVHLRLSVK